MIPKFIELSKEENEIIGKYSSVLEKRADAFSDKFIEWLKTNKRFSHILEKYPHDKMRKGISIGYKSIIAPSKGWEENFKHLSEVHYAIGLSSDDLIEVYDMYFDDIGDGIEALEIDPSEKLMLKCAIRKRLEKEMFDHINAFQELQKRVLEDRERFYKAITDISKMINEYEDNISLDNMLREIATIVVLDIDLDLVWIGNAKPQDKWMNIIASAGKATGYLKDIKISLDPSIPEGRGPAGIALMTGKPYVLNDFDVTIFNPWKERADAYNLGGSANVSFKTRDGTIWNISMYNEKGKKFPEKIEDLLTDLSIEIRFLIEHNKKEQELKKLRNYERALVKIQRLLIKNPPPEMIYNSVVRIINAYTENSHTIHITVPDPNSEWMKTVAAAGEGANIFLNSRLISTDPQRFPQGQFSTSKCFREGRVVIMNPQNEPQFVKFWEIHPELSIRSVGSWPIFEKGIKNPVAVLTIGSRDPDYFSEDLITLVDQTVSSIEMAIDQYRSKEKIEWMGFHDPLTGLPNRSFFEQSFQNAIKRADREKKNLGIGLMDIDNFKEYNDTFGHIAGDDLLKRIGLSLSAILRGGDVVARLGGDEFILHVIFDDPKELDSITARIRKKLSSIDDKMTIYFSIGWAVYPLESKELYELIDIADKRMYDQKRIAKKTFKREV